MLLDEFHADDQRPLGAGRLGATWAGAGPRGERLVLKRLAGLASAAPEAAEMAERMTAVPACVAPVGIEARGGDLFVLYPFVAGAGPVDAARKATTAVCVDLERAVADLHAAGLVHGALCDSNVRFTADGKVRLLEVGLAGLGALGAVGVATVQSDRRDLAALRRQMTVAAVRRGQSEEQTVVAAGRRCRRGAVVLLSVVVLLIAVFGVARTGRRSAPRCATRSLAGEGGATYFAVDMNGTGCAEPVAWADGAVYAVSPDGKALRFSLGRPGDVLLIGRWFCSRQLPALYRRVTGEVFYLKDWPLGGMTVRSEPALETGVREGRARTSGTGGCQHVEVAR